MPICYNCGEETEKYEMVAGNTYCPLCADEHNRGLGEMARPKQNPFAELVVEQKEKSIGGRTSPWFSAVAVVLIIFGGWWVANWLGYFEPPSPPRPPLTDYNLASQISEACENVSKVSYERSGEHFNIQIHYCPVNNRIKSVGCPYGLC